MLRFVFAALLFVFPFSANAELAPQACAAQFLDKELPNVDAKHSRKARMLCFSQYGLLHSALTKTPVWSAEHLTKARLKKASGLERKNPFHAETRLPADERAELKDYKSASDKFDRGHMSPNGDMPNAKAQRESFSLANMIPQNACNNEEIWEGIESAVRTLAKDQGEVYVVTGPIYPVDSARQKIGNGVAVPTQIFKAIYVPALKTAAAYVTANEDTKDLKAVSLDDLTKLTGVDAFPHLSADIKMTAMQLPPPESPKFKCRLRR